MKKLLVKDQPCPQKVHVNKRKLGWTPQCEMSAQTGSVTFTESPREHEPYYNEIPVTRPQFPPSTHVLKCLNPYRIIAMWNWYCVNNATDLLLKKLLMWNSYFTGIKQFFNTLVSYQTTSAYFSHKHVICLVSFAQSKQSYYSKEMI